MDITTELDRNNLHYADTLMAMARALLAQLTYYRIDLGVEPLAELGRWFKERVLTTEEAKEFSSTLQAGAQAKGGLPFLLDLFAKFTSAFRANVTYKDSLRHVIRNSFTQFKNAFNDFLRVAEAALNANGFGRRVLFLIDGTDKLRGEDTKRFFVEDAEQLLAIDALIVYTAPLNLKYEGNLMLDADLVLPMIKLFERDAKTPWKPGWKAMRDILLKRADRSLFASNTEIDRIVEHSGGHPREMLRLLKLCCEFAEERTIDAKTVALAIQQLASEYRRFLEPKDYAHLASLDVDSIHAGNDERTRKLLYNLALLEYNDGAWRHSHPVVRTLEGYTRAVKLLGTKRG